MRYFGNGRLSATLSSTRVARRPGIEVSTSMARHSRVKSSTTTKARILVPPMSASETKSIDHRSFGAVGGGRTVRNPDARRLRSLRRTASPSAR